MTKVAVSPPSQAPLQVADPKPNAPLVQAVAQIDSEKMKRQIEEIMSEMKKSLNGEINELRGVIDL